MPQIRALVNRRFSWRLMLLGACVSLVIGPLIVGWRAYPWAPLPFAAVAMILLHPLMDQDLPTLIGLDLLKSPRTYLAIALFVIGELLRRASIGNSI